MTTIGQLDTGNSPVSAQSLSTPETSVVVVTATAGGAVSSSTATTSPTFAQASSIATAASIPTAIAASPSQSTSSSSGISTKTVAGAAVGAAVGGALLAFIITFLFMRSRNRKQNKQPLYSEKRNGGKQAEVSVAEVPAADLARPKSRWEKHLPQPADDNSVRLSVKTLMNQVELHVETFYVNLPTPVKLTEEVQTELDNVDSPHLPDSLVVILPQARDQTVLIKHCLANMIVSNISGGGAFEQSFLPLDFIVLPRAMQLARRKSRKAAFSQALSRWRVLTSYLRPETESDQAYLEERDANIRAAADVFGASFRPWANQRYNSASRRQNLTEIMKTAADAGILIFSQPSTFDYIWTTPASARRSGVEVVVTPAFAKVTDENAQVLESPYVMVQPVVHGL